MSTSQLDAQRPLPASDGLRVWRDFIETSDLLRRVLGARMQHDSELSLADYAVLLALSEAERRTLRASDLAEAIEWDRSRLSHHLARMEKRELIRRERCPDDNRGSLVILTNTGAQLFRSGSVPHLRDVRELFIDALTPQQLSALGDAVATLRTSLNHRGDTDIA